MTTHTPAYIKALESGALDRKVDIARKAMRSCVLCPRRCRVNRLDGEIGRCQTGQRAWVSSFNAHFGEEAPLVGRNGSGTIFFTHCNLLCCFCQNYDISHEGCGRPATTEELAAVMCHLQAEGCHNINFVTPSHVVPQILAAVAVAARNGLSVPLVYNSSGYDSMPALKLLDGVIDIYMPDFKFWDPEVARRTCDAPDYPDVARRAVTEMHRQVGDLRIDAAGVAVRGLLIRHLVMPSGMAGTADVMRFIATRLSANSYVNLMAQYRPCGRVSDIPELNRRPTDAELTEARRAAGDAGIVRLDQPRRIFVMW